MGGSRLVRYRIEVDVGHGRSDTGGEWRTRSRYGAPGYGAPTNQNLAKWVKGMEQSARPGGVNAHLSKPHEPYWINSARIVDQLTGRTVATYRGASFRVF